MTWSSRRRLTFISAIFIVLVALAFYSYKSFIYQAPSCTDKVQNQKEEGIDCGGPCSLVCKQNIKNIVQVWDPRLFKIADGIYTSVVYLENPNVNAGAKNVQYSFKLYEASQPGVLLAEREGVIDVYPEKGFPIIETKIYTGKRTAGRVVFNIDAKSAKWEKMSAREEKVVVKDQQISSEDTAPRVVANVENIGNIPASNIDVVAVVFDINGNAIGASRTFVESLARGEKQQVSFTWPEPFAAKSAKVDLYVRTNAIQY